MASNSIAIWNYQVARQIVGRHDVTLFALGDKYRGGFRTTAEGIHVRHHAQLLNKISNKLARLGGRVRRRDLRRPCFASGLWDWGYAYLIARELRGKQFEIVHLHNFSQFVPILRDLNPRVKIILHMHCEWLSQLDPEMVRERLAKTDVILGCSDHITCKVRTTFPQYATRCHTVPNGMDPIPFGQPSPRHEGACRRLLYVGRVSPEKGLHDLFDAFVDLSETMPDLELTIVGRPGAAAREFLVDISDEPLVRALDRFYGATADGSGASYIDDLMTRLPPALVSRVEFTGHVDYEQISSQYERADIVVNPSLSELFGMSLVEAMVAARPVVATRVGGMTEIVRDGETGLLVPPGNALALTQALQRLLENDAERVRMGRAGRQRSLSRFTWKNVSDSLLRVYEQLG